MLKFGGEDMLSLKMGWYPLKLPTRISSLGSLLPYRTSWKLSARGNSRSNRPGAKFFWQGCNLMQCNGHRPMILSTVIFCVGLLALWRLDTGTLVGTQKFFTTFWGDVHRAAKIWKGQFPSLATLPAKWWQPDIVSLLVKYDFAILSSNAEEMLIEENGDQKYIQETKEMIAASFVSAHLFLVLARVASSCCYLFS